MKKQLSFVLILLTATLVAVQAQAGLKEYVAKPDPTYTYEVVESRPVDGNTMEVVRLTSQTWEGIVWKHWMAIVRPPEVAYPETAFLVIGGGSISDTPPAFGSEEGKIANLVAKSTKSVVALLLQVPNEPLFNGLNEDEIIAYTYDKYLNGEGEEWPLLLPMAKSAVRAMDTVQAVMKDKYQQEVKGFVLTGGSKRGWTTWLTAATGDPRVKAIAPVVIDVLNMREQMQHQLDCYGSYSNQVGDYTDLDIQQRMDTPAGKKLLGIVDPYAYRDALTLPKLVLLGTNDPYWTVDASSLYFPDLKGEKHLYYQANTEHDVNALGVATLTQFYNAAVTGKPFPKIEWKKSGKGRLDVRWSDPKGKAMLWQATSKKRDFRESEWTSEALEGDGKVSVRIKAPKKGWTAFYVEVRFPGDFGFPFGSCTEMTVLPNSYPKLKAEAASVAKTGKGSRGRGKAGRR